MFNEGTERPFTSDLLKEKERVFIIAQIVEINYLHQFLSLIAELAGLHFLIIFPMLWGLKTDFKLVFPRKRISLC